MPERRAQQARADETVNSLQSQGYIVQLNGNPSASLSACTVASVGGLSDHVAVGATAYVEVTCPTGC